VSTQPLELLRKTGEVDNNRKSIGLFKCSCGAKFEAVISNVKSGNTKSCGCYKLSQQTTHGQHKSKAYKAWADAKSRCFNPRTKAYKTHGARGITMCMEWADSFESFFAEMGHAPKGTSLDREDDNGNYEPGNCRWADISTQNRNTRTACFWHINGAKFESLREAAAGMGVSTCTIIRWVDGRTRNGKTQQPKENCFKVNRV